MNYLRNALANAMRRSGIPDAYVVEKADDGHYIHTSQADAILADSALQEAILMALTKATRDHEPIGPSQVQIAHDRGRCGRECAEAMLKLMLKE